MPSAGYIEASGGSTMQLKRRVRRLLGAVTDIVDLIRWAVRQRRLSRQWRLPPEKEDDMKQGAEQ